MKHTCPGCGRAWELAESLAGRRVTCQHCGTESFGGFPPENQPSFSVGAAPPHRKASPAQPPGQATPSPPLAPEAPVVLEPVAAQPAHARAPQPAAPRALNGFGLAALILGVLACITCWIPFIGVVSMPVSGLGLLFGVIGLFVAGIGKRLGVGLPVAGSVVCAAAIVIALWPYLAASALISGLTREQGRKPTPAEEKKSEPWGSPQARQPSPAPPRPRPPYVAEPRISDADLHRGLEEERARRAAEARRRLDAEKAAAEEQVQREKIQADKRMELERIRREEARAKLLPRFKAATNEHGLLLVLNNLQAWATTLEVMTKDADLFSFSGTGIDDSALPPRDLKFTGRIKDDGTLVLDLSNQSGAVHFDKFLETGMFSHSEGGYVLIQLNETTRKEYRDRREAVARILNQKIPEPTITLYDARERDKFAKVARMKLRSPAADGNVGRVRATGNTGMRWVDGDLRTYWNPHELGTYSFRYKEPQTAAAIGLFLDDTTPLETTVLTVNGQRRIPLPSVPYSGSYGRVLELRFPQAVELFEVRFDVLRGGLALREIVIFE